MVQVSIQVCFLQLGDSIWVFRENALTIFALLSMYNKNIRWASSLSASYLSTLSYYIIFSNIIINKIFIINIISIILVIIIIINLNGILMIPIQGQVRSEMQSDCAMKTNTFALRHFHFQLSKTSKNKGILPFSCQKQEKKTQIQIHPRIKTLTNTFTITRIGLHF